MEVFLFIAVAALLLAGLLGTLWPVLPGNILIFAAISLWYWYDGFDDPAKKVLLVSAVLTLLAQLTDYLASVIGARRFGSSWFGVLGSVLGGLVGFFSLTLPGLITGLFAGAVLFEVLFARREMSEALRAGWGSLLGFLCGGLVKFLLGLTTVAIFLFEVFSR